MKQQSHHYLSQWFITLTAHQNHLEALKTPEAQSIIAGCLRARPGVRNF